MTSQLQPDKRASASPQNCIDFFLEPCFANSGITFTQMRNAMGVIAYYHPETRQKTEKLCEIPWEWIRDLRWDDIIDRIQFTWAQVQK